MSSGSDAVRPGPPSPTCTNGPNRPMRMRTGSPRLGIGRRDRAPDSRPSPRPSRPRPSRPRCFSVAVVELAEELDRLALAARDLVEVLLHLRGEVGLDEVAEMLAQQLRHGERGEARHERLALPEHVAAADDRGDRRRERRRPADAEPLQLLDQRRFGEPRRRRGLVPLRLACRASAIGVCRRGRIAIADLALRQDRLPDPRARRPDRRCLRRRRGGSRRTRSPCRSP